MAGLSLSICYHGSYFYFFIVIYHNKFCRSSYSGSLLNKSITKTWGDVWYKRKCNHKKKKPRIEIIWLLSTLPGCLRQLHISIELFYDQASMLLKYYLFSLSHSDKKWQALRTVIRTEHKIGSCGQNSAWVKHIGFGEFALKATILGLYFQIRHRTHSDVHFNGGENVEPLLMIKFRPIMEQH